MDRRSGRCGSLETWTWRILLRAARDQRTRPWTTLDDIDPVVLEPEVAATLAQSRAALERALQTDEVTT